MIITADKNEVTDSAYHSLVKHIKCDIPIVIVSWVENFVFNDALLNIKDFILICYCEYGWDYKIESSHIWGLNKDASGRYIGEEWNKFDNWVKENPFKILFKRELLKKDVSDTVKPIEYTTCIEPIPIQSEVEFNSRPITAAYYFGRSHEGRLRLHSDIWRGATEIGYSVCDNIYYFNGFMQNEIGRKYVSMHIPHYQRHPINELMIINGMSKIGIAPFGAGIKTFRHSEVSCNSVMITWENDLAWSYDWVHGVNCIKCKEGQEISTIEFFNDYPELYNIYLEGVKTWDKYRVSNYINNYLIPLINAVL